MDRAGVVHGADTEPARSSPRQKALRFGKQCVPSRSTKQEPSHPPTHCISLHSEPPHGVRAHLHHCFTTQQAEVPVAEMIYPQWQSVSQSEPQTAPGELGDLIQGELKTDAPALQSTEPADIAEAGEIRDFRFSSTPENTSAREPNSLAFNS